MHTHIQPFLPPGITGTVQTSTAFAAGSQTPAVTRAAAGATLQGNSRALSPPDSDQAPEMQQQAERCVCIFMFSFFSSLVQSLDTQN